MLRDLRERLWIRTSEELVYYTFDAKEYIKTEEHGMLWDGRSVFKIQVKWMNLIETDEIIIVPALQDEVIILGKDKKITNMKVYNSPLGLGGASFHNTITILESYKIVD